MRPLGRPSLLALAVMATGFGGVLCLGTLVLAALGRGTYEIGGEMLRPGAYLRAAGILVGVGGVALLAIARGLFRGSFWVRPLILAFWAYIAALVTWSSAPEQRGALLLMLLIPAGFTVWYLYAKRTVVEYFRECREADA